MIREGMTGEQISKMDARPGDLSLYPFRRSGRSIRTLLSERKQKSAHDRKYGRNL